MAGPVLAVPQWQALPAAPQSVRMDDVHFLDADRGWVCTAEGRIHHTTDGGSSWTLQHDDPALYFRSLRFADALRGFAGTLNSDDLLYRTTDGGGTWASVPGIPEPRPNAICGLAVASSQVIFGVGSYSEPARMIHTTDGGASWASRDLAPLASTLIDVQFRSATEGLAVGSVGSFPAQSRSVVLRTTDGGTTWQRVWLGSRNGEWGWKITFPSASVGYVSLERFLGPMFFLKTTDGGATWNDHGFPNYNEQGIGFATPLVGWVGGANNPTLGTTDGGASWTPTPWGDYLNRFQFLSPTLGYGSGVTVYKYAEGAVGTPGPAPPPLALRAGPNPFVAQTTIRFALAAPTPIRLFVADPSGRVVRELERGTRAAGAHVVVWDGRDDRGAPAPAGIYLYVLHAGPRHEMGKLVRVR